MRKFNGIWQATDVNTSVAALNTDLDESKALEESWKDFKRRNSGT